MEREKQPTWMVIVAGVPLLLAVAFVGWDLSATWRAERSRRREAQRAAHELAGALGRLIGCSNNAAPADGELNLFERLWSAYVLGKRPQLKLGLCVDRFSKQAARILTNRGSAVEAALPGLENRLSSLARQRLAAKTFLVDHALWEVCVSIQALRRQLLPYSGDLPRVACRQAAPETHWIQLPRPIWEKLMSLYTWYTSRGPSGALDSKVTFSERRDGESSFRSRTLLVRTYDGQSWEALPIIFDRRSRVDWGARDAIALIPEPDHETNRRWRFQFHSLESPAVVRLHTPASETPTTRGPSVLRLHKEGWTPASLFPVGISPGAIRRTRDQIVVLGYRKGLVAGIIRGRPDTTQFEAFDPLQKVERSGVERLLVVPNGEAFVLLSDKTASRGFFLVYSQLPGFRAKKTFQAKRSTTQVGLEVCRRGDIVWVLHGREQVFRGELGQNRWTRVHAFGTSWGEVELACTRRSVMVVGTRREGTKGPFLHYAECDGRGCRVPRVLTRRSVRGFGARVDPMERFEVFTYGLDDLGARLRWDDGRWHAQPVLAPTERVAFEIMALDIDGAPFRMKRTFISAE